MVSRKTPISAAGARGASHDLNTRTPFEVRCVDFKGTRGSRAKGEGLKVEGTVEAIRMAFIAWECEALRGAASQEG